MTAPVPSRTRRHVPSLRAAALTYRVLVRQVLTPGKMVALGGLGALMMLVGWLVGLNTVEGERGAADLLRDGAGYADGFGLIIIVPIVSLVFGSSVLGETREDGTLVYLWLRPMTRAPVVVGAAAAAATAALPLTVIPTAVGGWLAADRVAGSADVALAAAAAAALGTAAYSSLFVLIGLLVKKPIIWGIGYVLLWEGLAVGLGDFAARLSLRGYTRSVLSRVGEIDYGFDPHTTTTALVVLAAVSVAGLALAAIRLNRLEVD
ncbi:MAG: hypothetical protein OXC06_08750 [Acidimicrobiaceae bacterium]|nr:hypothetical protein [Acidimicrobiaceae bacterium]